MTTDIKLTVTYMIVTRFKNDTGEFVPNVYKNSEQEFMTYNTYSKAAAKADHLTGWINSLGYEGEAIVVLVVP